MKKIKAIAGNISCLKKPLLMIGATLMVVACFTLKTFAGPPAQTITLNAENKEILQVLSIIEQQAGCHFLYNSRMKSLKQKVTVNFRDAALNEALQKLFAGTGLTYQQMDNNLVAIRSVNSNEQDITVTGTVINSSGVALMGVSVTIKGSTGGTSTDGQGKYSISVPENAVLVFSSVGYESMEVPVAGKALIDVTLNQSINKIDEVVVIGYGTANKRDLTGSIVSVKAKEIADRPSSNALNLLQGKVAGVSVVSSGRPGTQPDVRIRGTNSINGATPVYIVDGIFVNDINFLNPADIESMDILKDASSLAIFGVRGANGAIAITTKKAKAGQLLVNFNTSFGFKSVQNKMQLTDGPQFKTLYDEQMANMGTTYDDAGFTSNTDWQDEIFQNGFITLNNVSITSASEKNRLYLSLGYMNEDGIILHENFQRYTVNLSNELKVSKALKFGFTFNGSYGQLPMGNLGVGSAIRASPTASVYGPDEELLHTMPSFQRAQVFNPLVGIETQKNTQVNKNYRSVGSIYGEINFLKDFTFRAQVFGDYSFNTGRSYQPIIVVYNPQIAGPNKSDSSVRQTSVSQNQAVTQATQQDYLLTYKKTFGDNQITAMGGLTTIYNGFETTSSSVQQGNALQIPNDPRFWYVDGVGSADTKVGSGSAYQEASISYLARVLYTFKKRYLFTGSFRTDGSSQFQYSDNAYKSFYAFGGGWIISQEDFFADVKAINFLKLKGSWGILGSKNIPQDNRYPGYPVLNNSSAGVFGDNVVNALTPDYTPSPDLNWESNKSWEIGVELNAFSNALHFEATYYNKVTDGVITRIARPNGLNDLLANLGTIENKGFELAATYTKDLADGLNLTVSGNFTTINNEVTQLNQTGYTIINGPSVTQAGHPIGYFFGYKSIGIYQTAQEIIKSPASMIGTVKPGDIKYADINGDGVITDADREQIGNPTPDFLYGGSIGLTYKGFDLGIDLQGVYGNEIYRAWNQGTFADFNYQVERLDRWNGVGTSNWEPILSTARANNYQNSSYWIEDGSFFRIRNLQLGYTFGAEMLAKAKIKSLRFYINMQNPATFFNSTGYTPEIGGSATSFGVDNGTYPVPAIYTAGLNLNF